MISKKPGLRPQRCNDIVGIDHFHFPASEQKSVSAFFQIICLLSQWSLTVETTDPEDSLKTIKALRHFFFILNFDKLHLKFLFEL